MSQIFLVSGGCRSGKSRFALSLAETYERAIYLATAQVYDDEMADRVLRHQQERPSHMRTIEEPLKLEALLETSLDCDVLIWDCLTLWLSNMLCEGHSIDQTLEQLQGILSILGSQSYDSIIVSNEVGLGIVPESALGRQFRDLAGWAHQMIVPLAKEAYLLAMGVPIGLKALQKSQQL
ncbi:bifunctional adenosylcobinamide kinase/adenosylcobinamide-phosphate guanylyltransferase [Pseudobacteriovorax antillogorgiicola]|uniref:Adenosylcobinamide kinase n=1 Tax=Pseudobacteriovorax antillogorgiicola TaxID=1513793 RepID=A0A1Y6C184_9BACT|nr:bifunctional adenosylcobinamide kinase/adenosylcobinamide-phosphate guanylyltransferase [Pseudobacteriovorax antillogorgiicola]TCS50685.1 adenosylcobinamide kinase /adenosylcobinamide-phosphate guanylyltransferase [Pseudobacteriovorax antillogorgiicola]SMF40218.1 adenosylcobinamide kinase /adenosylcobinamide-phosphate guanylyltransferase [Pseudobacteriovorax antillogorgiicola]